MQNKCEKKMRYGDSRLSLRMQQVRLGFNTQWIKLLKQTSEYFLGKRSSLWDCAADTLLAAVTSSSFVDVRRPGD